MTREEFAALFDAMQKKIVTVLTQQIDDKVKETGNELLAAISKKMETLQINGRQVGFIIFLVFSSIVTITIFQNMSFMINRLCSYSTIAWNN